LDGFDPRIVENVLQGFEKSRPSANMVDFGVTAMDETYGRERRHRWFTFKGYKALLNQESISEAEHGLSVDLTNTGGFTDMSSDLFYTTLDQLHQYQDTDSREETKKKRKPPKNPILPDGTVKRGRPRKIQPGTSKRKREDAAKDAAEDGQAHPSKRAKTVSVGAESVGEADQGTPVVEPAPRKRVRPPKRKPEGDPPATPAPSKRGRPPKNRPPAPVEERGAQDDGGQTQSTATLSITVQEAVTEIPRDETGLPLLSYPDDSERITRQEAITEADTLPSAGDSQQTPPPELNSPGPESRELVQRDGQNVNKVSVPTADTNANY
jgi:hypothetical protein